MRTLSVLEALSVALATPPRDPTQVPPPLKDEVGKHNETEFNDDEDTVDYEEGEDDESDPNDD